MTDETARETIQSDVPAGGFTEEYVEEYVEVVDNRRRVVLLAIVLLVLLLTLGVLGWFLWGSLTPAGAPRGEVTQGMVWVRSIYGWGSNVEERLRSPIAVAVAPDGTYWTVSNHDTVVGFDQNGRLAGLYNLPRGEGEGEILAIEGIAFDAAGNLYVADYGNAKVLKVLPDGTVDGEVGVSYAQRVATSDDKLAIASTSGVALLGLAEGELITQWGGRGRGLEEFDSVRGVDFGEDGTVFTSDSLNRRVKAYSPEGRVIWSFPDTATVEAARQLDQLESDEEKARIAESIPFELPGGLTVDAAGRIVLVDGFKMRISTLDPRTGEVQGTYGRDGTLDGQFVYPSDIAYDAARDQFVVADTGNHRLQILRIEGSGGTPLSIVGRLRGQPVWVCCFPLALLLALLAMALLRSRRRKVDHANGAESAHVSV
jgi:sugar lactone lactonase YvrE